MKRLFSWLMKRSVLSLIAVLVLALLVWTEGPFHDQDGHMPYASALVRWAVIAIMLVAWAAFWTWRVAHEKIAARKLSRMVAGDSSAASDATPGDAETAAEMAALATRLNDAISMVRKQRKASGGDLMYSLPWYMFIGAPGSGKTTALVHSGLQFPLAETMGHNVISGVGGTRNCDWWFTDEAVLLDTAGRYTTQDSHAEVDNAAWFGLLGLLKKHRARRPLNGVIVAISIGDLLQKNDDLRKQLALSIRGRIKELHEELGIRFPIYVMVTKCDLLAGFFEFFDPLSREERAQVWGATFALHDADRLDNVLQSFPGEFEALESQLQARVLERMQNERDVQRCALLYGFPQQFAELMEPLNQLLTDIFQSTRYEQQAMLRGVYFTSGTQEGNPIDRVIGSLASAFGLDRQSLPANVSSGRSFFVTRMLRDVIFREAGLAGANLRLERERRALQWAVLGLLTVVLVIVLGARVVSFFNNVKYVDRLAATVTVVARLSETVARNESLLATLPMLNAARSLPTGYAERDASTPLLMRLGMYQGWTLSPAAIEAYRRLLRESLLPRLVIRLEDQLRRGGANNADYLFEALRMYLMLADRKHLNAETLQAWFELDWSRNLPEASDIERQQLATHVAALIEYAQLPEAQSVQLMQPDAKLVAGTRLTLARTPLPQRIYERLKKDFTTEPVAEFSAGAAGGRTASLVLIRYSGAPLTRGVPGMYTAEGYRKILEQTDPQLAAVALDSWVFGQQEAIASLADIEQTKLAISQLYFGDYITQWDQYLADVGIAPFTSLAEGARLTAILAGPESPLKKFLQAAAVETTLENVRSGGLKLPTSMVTAVQGSLSAYRKKLEATLGVADAAPMPVPAKPVNPVDAHFQSLHALVGPLPVAGAAPPGPAPLDQMLAMLKDVSVYFDDADLAKRTGTPVPASDILQKVKRAAMDKPALVSAMLQNIDNLGGGIALGGDRARINAAWAIGAAQFCRQAITGRYPLVRGSATEVLPDDFGKFFAPGGMIDEFFQKNLQQYVDMSGARWRWNAGAAANLGIPPEALAEFERAARIRDMFFRGGGKLPSMRFELRPLNADKDFTNILLEIDGQPMTWVPGTPGVPTLFQVPSGKGAATVRIEATPAGARPDPRTEGPWAWLRMLDRALVETTPQAERFKLNFDLADRKLVLDMTASSVINPFRREALEQFHCLERL